LDLAIDGADEADRELSLIKGGGGALLREKIVAASARRMIVIADSSKLVERLGRFPLPVEVTPFGHGTTAKRIRNAAASLGYENLVILQRNDFETDGGNLVYDCAFGSIRDPRLLAMALAVIPGVVDHGLFLNLASTLVFGGTCVIRGCIPKKLFVYASHFGEDFEDCAAFGWTVPERRFDWNTLVANKNKEVARLESIYRENVEKEGVETIVDRAEFDDAHTVVLKKSGARVTAKRFLIATGSRPSRDLGHGVLGAEHCITSDEAFYLEKFPRRIVSA